MAINNTPNIGPYTELKPFRFWCQKVLPLVYDESLSYYELLCKVVDYLNKTMEDVDQMIADMGDFQEAYKDFITYINEQIETLETFVNNYFNNLDVQQEINNKIDAMAEAGYFDNLFNTLFRTDIINEAGSVTSAWIAENLLQETGYVIDNSLTVANAAADAKVTGDRITTVKDVFNNGLFSFGPETLDTMSSTFGTETGLRFNAIGAAFKGYINKITIKGKTTAKQPLTIYIGKENNGSIDIIDQFVITLPNTNNTTEEMTFINGIEFYNDTLIEDDYLIGWWNHTGQFNCCYDTNGTSYKTVSNSDMTIDTTNAFQVGIYTECTVKLNEAVNKLAKTANAIKSQGLFLNYTMPNYSDCDEYTVKVKPTTLANSYITIKKKETNNAIKSIITCGVYFFNDTFGFYYGAKDSDPLETYDIRKCKFSFVAGHEYVIKVTKILNTFIKLTVTDAYTLDSDFIYVTCCDGGYGWGAWSCDFRDNGTQTQPTKQYRYVLDTASPICLIIGDSITEGTILAENGENQQNGYAYRIKKELNNSVFIESRGGAGSTSAKNWLTGYLNQIVRPKYAIVYIGTNDTAYNTWLTNIQDIISALTAINAIPILVTIAPNAGDSNAFMAQMNTWIKQSGYAYIDANAVLSLNNDGVTANPALYFSDLTHPNSLGQDALFKRAMLDVPELFRNSII